ncbi:MAG: NAD(P)H-dependent oxidoreductase [Legionellaceae bacterium]|nr:NAD(P)H-dependent oxidoreductase [Legionellaceae bacterium]
MKIGVFVGSLRLASFNRKVATTLIQVAPASLDMEIIEIGQLSFFNQDDEANPPKSWILFREKLKTLDGFILVTPEYNRSVPAVLKNALDVGSRPYGQNIWDGKPCAIVSASIGAIGGFGANHHLRQSLVFLNTPCMTQPEAYLSHVDTFFNEKGQLTNEGTKTFLSKFMESFAQWVKTNAKK